MSDDRKKSDGDPQVGKEPCSYKKYSNEDIMGVMKKAMEKLTNVEKKLEKALAENRKLREEAESRDKEVIALTKRIDTLEQRSRINNLEIANFPATTNENPVEIVKAIAGKVGVEISDKDIQAVHRVPKFNKNAPKNIVVQFCSRWTKNIILDACARYRKNNNGKIMAQDVNRSLRDQPIFISEHLTPKNKQLLRKTKEKARLVNWKYIWTRDGNIYTRKDQNSQTRVQIREESDLANVQ
ncbi:hypothetical protein M8J76_010252 [Diaphorina citri]|nr:hypothetical protein M8J76_010252 [Diaphorina citri]